VAAVSLLIERAEEADLTFILTVENAPAIAELCRTLDGLPLAIELAAPRLKLLSPRALLTRLTHRLQVLTDGPRDLPDRQKTLRDTIAWSYELLTPAEQALFRQVAVFAAGTSLEAIEVVADISGTGQLDSRSWRGWSDWSTRACCARLRRPGNRASACSPRSGSSVSNNWR